MTICFQTWRYRTVLGMLFVERHGWRYIMVVEWDGKALTRIMTETSIEQLSTLLQKLKSTLVHSLSFLHFKIPVYMNNSYILFELHGHSFRLFRANQLSYHADLLGFP